MTCSQQFCTLKALFFFSFFSLCMFVWAEDTLPDTQEEAAVSETKQDSDEKQETADDPVTDVTSDVDTDQETDAEEVTATALYTHSDTNGLIIASGKRWYLEEYDHLGRPITGTMWENGTITAHTSWIYTGDSQQAEKKIYTEADESTETDYDSSGNCLSEVVTDNSGVQIRSTRNTYNERDLLLETVTEAGETMNRIVYTYTDADEVSKKEIYRNDMLMSVCEYTDEDNWTETVYKDGRIILVAIYEDGVRKK